MGFNGFPERAVEFYQELELNNSKDWWAGHVDVYTEAVKVPMQALLAELEAEFGEGRLFRPHRDVRFSKDKSPYKTHQGGYVASESGGFYVQVGPEGLLVAGGWWRGAPDQLARYRASVTAPVTGAALEKVVETLRRKGFSIGGDVMASRPRGVDADHPRLELMRHRTLTVGHEHGEPDWMSTAEALERVRADWRAFRPLIAWLDEHVGASTAPRR